MAKVTQILSRDDGSQVRIVMESYFFPVESIFTYVHRRENPVQPWILLNDRPHPDFKAMSRSDYMKFGRSEVFQHIAIHELLRVGVALAAANKEFMDQEIDQMSASSLQSSI